jgi:hypothetical protein
VSNPSAARHRVHDPAFVAQLNAVAATVTHAAADHLYIASVAHDAMGVDPHAFPYFPLTEWQAELAQRLREQGLLDDQHCLTELGSHLVEHLLDHDYPFLRFPDDPDGPIDFTPMDPTPDDPPNGGQSLRIPVNRVGGQVLVPVSASEAR